MSKNEFLDLLNVNPEKINFDMVMQVINDPYVYTPSNFTIGKGSDQVMNCAGSNEGSCKIFSFARLNHLNEKQTLACFGEYYRNDVLGHPDNSDHPNIRNFIKYGWGGVCLDEIALVEK